MKRSPPPRKTANLPASLHHQLNMYALAASAAGVGLLALARPAGAKIVYTPANVEITGKPWPIDFNHDGIVDFFLFHYDFHAGSGSALFACLEPFVISSRTHCGSSFSDPNAFRMGATGPPAIKAGNKIVGGERFVSHTAVEMGGVTYISYSAHGRWRGPWMNGGKGVKNRYLGVKFLIKGRFHFGWARLTVTTIKHVGFTATLTGYAYETIPGKGIIAGQTKGKDETDGSIESNPAALTAPPPEPAALGALAMGAPGLSIWRKKETSLGQ